MIYHREFTISSCHFNGADVYHAYREFRKPQEMTLDLRALDLIIIRMQMLASQVLAGTHGHNFSIVVEIEDLFEPVNDYLVDDWLIESVVMQWNNTNLSVHQDFKGLRATTENMAHLLSRKIMMLLWPAIKARGDIAEFIGPTITVTVHETDQIFARAVIDMADEPRKQLEQEQSDLNSM